MRSAVCLPLFLFLLCGLTAGAAAEQTVAPGVTDQAKILSYIHGSWDTLSRSMTSCKSVVDPKVTTAPILYLPAGMAVPPQVAAMQKECKVEVRNLPRAIGHLGDVTVADVPEEGLLYLPNRVRRSRRPIQ